MPERLCSCGNKLGPMQRNNAKCRVCKNQEIQAEKDSRRKRRAEAASNVGAILVHSCLADAHLDPQPVSCLCRKYVSVGQAKSMIGSGRCLDMATRQACFHQASIVETSRMLRPPVSSLGQRIAAQRLAEFHEQDITKMRAVADESKRWRDVENKFKVDFEQMLAMEPLAMITKIYSDDEWMRLEKLHERVPVVSLPFGWDERTLGGTGVNIPSRKATLESDRHNEEVDTAESEPIADTNVIPIEDQGDCSEPYDSLAEREDVFEDAA